MPEKSFIPPPSLAEVQASLHTISQLLRQVHPLSAEVQTALADLVDELAKSLELSSVPSYEIKRLVEFTTHLVQAVQKGAEPSVIDSTRNSLERAVIAVESEVPTLAVFTRRLADMLSNLGI